MSETVKIEAEDPANRMARKLSLVPPPKIGRSVRIRFQGDWGRANLHRAFGFLGYELLGLAGPYTRYAIWNVFLAASLAKQKELAGAHEEVPV